MAARRDRGKRLFYVGCGLWAVWRRAEAATPTARWLCRSSLNGTMRPS